MLQVIKARLDALELPALRPEWVTLSTVLFLLVFCNVPFWSRLLTVQPIRTGSGIRRLW